MKPIGVFDSGVGGLTVVRALRQALPDESILYLGDTARLPYGTKSAATVTQYTRRNIAFLEQRGVKAVVVACNTASALALGEIETHLPTWGVVEPGAHAAVERSRGRIGVIATESTVLSDAYGKAIRAVAPQVEVLSQACPLLVPLVEEGWHDDPIAEQAARRYLAPLVEAGIDTLVLGCTHYPLLAPVLRRVMGENVQLIDSGEAVARTVAAGLRRLAMANPAGAAAEHHFCVTDSSSRFATIARRILGVADLSLEWVDVF